VIGRKFSTIVIEPKFNLCPCSKSISLLIDLKNNVILIFLKIKIIFKNNNNKKIN
jgi:hypothetical protein